VAKDQRLQNKVASGNVCSAGNPNINAFEAPAKTWWCYRLDHTEAKCGTRNIARRRIFWGKNATVAMRTSQRSILISNVAMTLSPPVSVRMPLEALLCGSMRLSRAVDRVFARTAHERWW
jgi:hypothetical protein